MKITNLQLLAIALICLAAIIYYTWRSESVDRIAFLARERDAAKKQEERDADERERRRMVHEVDSRPASMEPFCGEGKKLTEKEKREELARLNLPAIANVPEHLRPDPYSYEANLAKAIKGIEKMPWDWPKL